MSAASRGGGLYSSSGLHHRDNVKRPSPRQVVRQASSLILIGAAIGLLGALAATPVLSSALYEVQPHESRNICWDRPDASSCLAARQLSSGTASRTTDPSMSLRMD